MANVTVHAKKLPGKKITGKQIAVLTGVSVKHALYRETGTYYHRLKGFPRALFDANGYIRFETPKAFKRSSKWFRSPKNKTYVRKGISNIPGYEPFKGNARKLVRALLRTHQAPLDRRETKTVVSPRRQNKSPGSRDGDAATRYLRNVQGFEIDPLVRKVIETAAVLKARRHYERAGFRVRERGKPFDLECRRGARTLFVEVKGTQTMGAKIFLTPNEIKFAQKHPMELFIVHSMIVDNGGGGPRARRGVKQIVTPWRPDRRRLAPVLFSYEVGPHA